MDWVKWALGEAVLRTASITLLKVIGSISSTLVQLAYSTAIIGTTQVIVPGAILAFKRQTPFTTPRQIAGSVAFGIGAFFGTMLPFVAFMLGANLAVYTFLALLAIVPGALIDRVFFGERLVFRQLIGICLAVVAGWLVLNAPSLTELAALPVWAWLALINACTVSINQGVSRWIKEVDIWVKNFWGGLATTVLCFATLLYFGQSGLATLVSGNIGTLTFWSGMIALIVIGLWSFNVLAYRSGASIPTKTVVVNGVYLLGSLLVGYVIFSDQVYVTQVLGILTYIGAFVLINTTVWNYITNKHV